MPTDYVESVTTNEFGFLTSDSFQDAPYTLEIGDRIIGGLGSFFDGFTPDSVDNTQVILATGFTYTFTIEAANADQPLSVFLDGETASRAAGDAETTFSLEYTATTDGPLQMSMNGLSGYTITLSSAVPVVAPEPTEGDDNLTGNMTADRVDLLGGNDTYVALGGSDVVTGGDGNDHIDGVCGNDTLEGNDGNDTLIGGNGRDVIFGGADADLIDGGNQEDMLDGGTGNDTLIGEKGDDTIIGGEGDDEITGGKDNDSMTGGAGADIFRFSNNDGQDTIADFTQGEDLIDLTLLGIWDISQLTIQDLGSGVRINTGNGNYIELTGLTTTDLTNSDFILVDPPVITTTDGGDDITGTGASEEFLGGDGADRLRGEGGDDTIDGGSGRDTLFGGDGLDSITGGSGQDQIRGGDGADTLLGGADNDRIYGDDGADLIDGGNANDRLYGGLGSDTIIGENGNDKLYGESGQDSLLGGAGKDTIDGGSGDDTIDGGQGDDILTGGAGADVFVFSDDRTRADTITDFNATEDVIDLTALGFTDLADVGFVQQGANVFVQFSDRDSLLLLDVDLSDLNDSNVVTSIPTDIKSDDIPLPAVADVEDVFLF